MLFRMRNSGALVLVVLLAVVAYELGHTLGAAIKLFSVMVWTVVAITFIYMTLFKGMKFTVFKGPAEPEVVAFDEEDAHAVPATAIPGSPAPGVALRVVDSES